MSLRTEKQKILTILVVLVLIGVGAMLSGSLSNVQSAAVEPWPSFVMVYRDWGSGRGPNNTPGYVVVRLIYKNSRDWQTEIVEDSVAPDTVGSRGSFTGNTARGFNTRFKQSSQEQYPPTALLAPDDWLVPGRIARLKTQTGSVVLPTSTPGIVELVHTEQVRCVQISGLAPCKAPTFQVITRIRYRPEHELPLYISESSDGILRREVTVIDFTLLP